MVITKVVKEDMWLKGLFGELHDRIKFTTIFGDNQSVIFLSKDQMFNDQTRHIDIRFHFVLYIIENGDCILNKINTNFNHVDIFIKSLPIATFKLFLDLVGVSERN